MGCTSTLVIPRGFHQVQLEYELREKTILCGKDCSSQTVMPMRCGSLLQSLPAFATLFRHALLELGEPAAASKREAVQKLAEKIGFDAAPFLQMIEIREGKPDSKAADLDVNDLCARYLKTVEQVTAAVDKMLDSSAPVTT